MPESIKKRGILHEFARNANIEGINNAGRAPTKFRVTVWLTIFVILGKHERLRCN